MTITDYHAKYFAYELTKRCSSDSMEKLAGAVAGAQVDLEEFTPLTGKEVWPKRTSVWRYAEVTHKLHVAEKRIRWGKDNTNGVPAFKRFRTDINTGVVPQTILEWTDASWKASPTRRATRSTGSRAIPPSAISSTRPRNT